MHMQNIREGDKNMHMHNIKNIIKTCMCNCKYIKI